MNLTLVCPNCKREDNTAVREPSDPPTAVRVVLICPDCDDSDLHAPEYFDAEGRHLNEETGRPFDDDLALEPAP